MEIDFLGLGGDTGFPSAKDEVGSKDSIPDSAAVTLGMQRSFPDKAPKPSWMLSFQAAQVDKPGRAVADVGPKLLPSDSTFQKNVLDAPTQRYHAANGFPLQRLRALSLGSSHETRQFPVLTHLGQTQGSDPRIQSQPPVLNSGHFPIGHTVMLPASRPQIGSPVSRDTQAPKSPGAPAQLTIFFAGSVCVYDDLSPEKAQAVMSLARESSSVCPSKPITASQVQPPPSRPSLDEASGGKNSPMLSFSPLLVDTQQVSTKQSITTAPTLVQAVAFPQARKVSLARFLERRKERMIKALPYGLNKSSPEKGGRPV